MRLATAIIQHLPPLRRYARAITGDQASGDDCVALMVERISCRDRRDGCSSTKVALYRELTDCLAEAPDECQLLRDGGSNALAHLQGLSVKSRQALLLVSLEGLSNDEAAQVLRLSPIEFTESIEAARRDLGKLLSTDVLIIEDEFFISRDLARIVTELGHKVCGRARTHAEAKAACERHPPGLILADIHLADGSSGIDAVRDLLETLTAPVIFITAYPERLLTGLRPEPTFLIAKPYRVEEVKAVVSQSLFFNQTARLAGTSPVKGPADAVSISGLVRAD